MAQQSSSVSTSLPRLSDNLPGEVVRLEKIKNVVQASYSTADVEMITRAWVLAHEAHADQPRKSGEPYITHPIAVAELLAERRMDEATVCAGLLHDVVEDTDVGLERIEAEFGEDVAGLVNGVTKVSQLTSLPEEEAQLDKLRQMVMATSKDLRVVIIKLCDRLHNMRTIKHLPSAKQKVIARSTLDLYSPLAHRMGMSAIKNELEDLAFSVLDPHTYKQLKQKVKKHHLKRQNQAKSVREMLEDVLATHGIVCRVTFRVKHLYSIYLKMVNTGKDYEDIHDLTGLRIITNSVSDCYAALGLVHMMYKQVIGRFKDYISIPKPNHYQSIHTTVLGSEGQMLEIQIRTEEMHRICEEGIAAHWAYKERKSSSRRLGADADWLKELSGLLEQTGDPVELMKALKRDVFAREVFVYTPKGEIIRLPRGATPIDLAYQIHTDVGDQCAGAKIGSRFVPISHQLSTGDQVEIVTSKSAHPNLDWLEYAHTPRARSKIRHYLLHQKEDMLVEAGKKKLSQELRKISRSPQDFFADEGFLQEIYKNLGITSLHTLLLHIGYGRITVNQVLSRLQQTSVTRKTISQPKKTVETIRFSQIDGVMYRRARCCAPVPGEPIVGLVTKGRGITVHRRDCRNIVNYRGDVDRFVHLNWEVDERHSETHTVQILVHAKDRNRLLADIATLISSTGTNIISTTLETIKNDAKFDFTVRVRDINHLDNITRQLIEIDAVRSVVRKGAGK